MSITIFCDRCGQAKVLTLEGVAPTDRLRVMLMATWQCWKCHAHCSQAAEFRGQPLV